MTRLPFALAACLLAALTAGGGSTAQPVAGEPAPVFGITLPADYREWTLITVAREEGSLDDLRAVLGNEIAIEAMREGRRVLPDGAVIARIAWAHEPLAESERAFGQAQSFVAGAPKNGVQFMVKDSVRFAATAGWGFAHFDDGIPASAEVHGRCLPCHQIVEERDFVFSRYAF